MDAFAYILSFFGLIVGYLFYLTIKQMNDIATDLEKSIEDDKIRKAWDKHIDDREDVYSSDDMNNYEYRSYPTMSFEDFRTCLEQRDKDKFDQMDELDQLISELNTLTEFGVLPDRIGGMGVIDKLCKISNSRAIEALIQAAENPKFSNWRMGAIYALGKIDDKRAIDSLVKTLSDKDKDIRKTAADALDKLGWKPEND